MWFELVVLVFFASLIEKCYVRFDFVIDFEFVFFWVLEYCCAREGLRRLVLEFWMIVKYFI